MSRPDRVFIPHAHCTMAGGDCFRLGRCLSACGARKSREALTEADVRRIVRDEIAAKLQEMAGD